MTLRNRLRGTALAATLAVLTGCVAVAGEPFYRPNFGPVSEKHTPVLIAAWAQPEIGWGHLYCIYVHATDPDGDLDKVWIRFRRPGASYEGTFLILPAAFRKTANGCVQVWMHVSGGATDTVFDAEALVHVEDRAGNLSPIRAIKFNIFRLPIRDKKNPPSGFVRDAKLGEMDLPHNMDLEVGDDDRGT